jgi:hypothetical protein
MKKLLLIPFLITLGACSATGPKVYVAPEAVDRAKFVTPDITPVDQLNFEWSIINKENANQKLAAQEKKTGSSTFFALTAQGYQNLSINVGELRRYIQQQKATIAALKKYYEAPVIKETAKDGK